MKTLFNTATDFKLLKKEFVDLEDLVFRSGKNYSIESVEYRLDIWKNKINELSWWNKICHKKSITDLSVREVSIRSRLVNIKKIEEEVEENM